LLLLRNICTYSWGNANIVTIEILLFRLANLEKLKIPSSFLPTITRNWARRSKYLSMISFFYIRNWTINLIVMTCLFHYSTTKWSPMMWNLIGNNRRYWQNNLVAGNQNSSSGLELIILRRVVVFVKVFS